jgi:26S proteasome regulatory subunit N9
VTLFLHPCATLFLSPSHSLGLIKGSIDQVNSLANIHWVQPRVLDADQSRALYERLSEWTDKIGGVVPTLSRGQGPLGVAA